MTAPIAGFVRPLSDVAAPSVHDTAPASSPDANGGSFRTALESAMKDKPAAASSRRAERARRDAQSHRSAEASQRAAKGDADNAASDTTRSTDSTSAADTKDSIGSTEKTFEDSVAVALGTRSASDEARPTGDVGGAAVGARGDATNNRPRPLSPDGGAWMRAGVRTSEGVESAASKGSDVDDGVDLSPTMSQDLDSAHFVQTAIADLASAAVPNVANDGGEAAALAGALAAGVAPAPAIVETSALTNADTPATVRRSVDALAPDLKLRLDRVIDRMKSEFGYSVEVVETVRSQSRQDQLFAQGRTEPGEIVTWTRNSKHTQGRAVDVIIDGSYENAAAYRDLAQVAREEGLRSLWPRDGGHLELPGRASSAGATSSAAVAAGEGSASEGAPLPALPAQARAAIDPKGGIPGVLLALPNQSRRDDSAPVIPTLPTIPKSAADVVLPHAAGTPSSPANDGGSRSTTEQMQQSTSAPPNGATRLTKLPVGEQSPPRTSGIANVAPVAQVARVAEVARVATIAPVAQVAQVAQVAAVGQVGGSARESQVGAVERDGAGVQRFANREQADVVSTSSRGAGSRDALTTVVTAASNTRTGAGAHSSNDPQQRDSTSKREKSREAGSAVASSTSNESVRAFSTRELATAMAKDGSATDSVGSLARSDATERIARVLKMQESAGGRPLSSVLLRLDSPDGGEDRVRIDLRGSTIGASFDVSDARAADNLRIHTNELQQALQRQGLEGDSITVRTTQRVTEPVSLNATALAGEREAGRIGSTAASDGGGSTAKDSRNQPRADDWREGASQQRSRQQRRDGKENR